MTMSSPMYGQNSNHYNRKQSDIAYHEAQERRLREGSGWETFFASACPPTPTCAQFRTRVLNDRQLEP